MKIRPTQVWYDYWIKAQLMMVSNQLDGIEQVLTTGSQLAKQGKTVLESVHSHKNAANWADSELICLECPAHSAQNGDRQEWNTPAGTYF